jgi:hypothetical protein
MSLRRQRAGGPSAARRSFVRGPEALEARQLLSGVPAYQFAWMPSDLYITNPISKRRELVTPASLVNQFDPNSPGLSNQGKVVSGIDRAGDKWVITVHGPGQVIVTDTTPNDGVLDDDINTIQLINTSINSTYVTGSVTPSNTELTEGKILFNQLLAVSGVRSIELNGFELSDAVTPSVTTPTGVFLYGGVRVLSFDSVDLQMDTSVTTTPYQIVIGSTNTPLKVQPSIYLNSINNLVFNSTDTTVPTAPVTSPSVQFVINGTIRNFNVVSVTQGTIPSGFQFLFPVVGTTGRTAVQATAIDNLTVHGSAKNFTVSRAAAPFSSESSGLNHLNKATFGGNADGVGIDVKGKIGSLTFKRGLGNPAGVFTGKAANGLALPQTTYGTPPPATGYPASGDLGGNVRASNIKKLTVRPANVLVQTPQNPDYVQLLMQGWPTYVSSPGYSLTNAVITTSGSIGQANVGGTQINSEIKTGFDYTTYVQGLEGTRAASKISALRTGGSLINAVGSATFRPANHHYAKGTGTAGPGQINVHLGGKAYDTGGTTGLGNTGAGIYAKIIKALRLKK